MIHQYRTISQKAESLLKEKGSKFYAFAYPVATVKEIETHLQLLQKIHYQARHHCYAYRLGPSGEEFRANDAGEPRHSAGDPILGQIDSFDLTNVLIVVVRYFGGTKLGLGGLVQAYKESARNCLAQAPIVIKELSECWVLSFAYPDLNAVMRIIKEFGLNIVRQDLQESCKITVEVALAKKDLVMAKLQPLHQVSVLVNN